MNSDPVLICPAHREQILSNSQRAPFIQCFSCNTALSKLFPPVITMRQIGIKVIVLLEHLRDERLCPATLKQPKQKDEKGLA